MPVESYRVIDGAPSAGEVIGTPSPASTDSTQTIPADAAMLLVEVPANAKIFVNGSATSATGGQRRFVSRGLAEGRDYDYVVRMVVDRDGRPVEETKVVSLSAGSSKSVSFNGLTVAERSAPDSKKTSLKLHVPAEAKVWLAGNETSSKGETRVFETTSLRDGQAWKGYEIKVAMVVDGREKVVSRTIDLTAGSSMELSIDPVGTRTASAEATASVR